MLPTDRLDYEAFVQFALRSATNLVSGEGEARPFQAGLRDGIDVRATLRHWHEGGELYIRESSRERVPVTDAVIDFEGTGEASAFLRVVMPWTDSSRLRVGSISRLCRANETLQQSPVVQRLHSGLCFVTLDGANADDVDRGAGKSATRFESRVSIPLLELAYEPDRDHLESWLDVFFRFARRKPVAYFSRYVPGARIQAVARQHGVQLQHVPLDRIPAELRERHRTFRVAEQNDEQWDMLRQRIAEGKGGRGGCRSDE